MATVVQSFWFGSALPALQVLSLRSFLAHGHDVHLYAFEPIDNLPDGVRLLDASAILPRDSVFTYAKGFGRGSPSAFSNVFRYQLLHDRGGWWVDTDVVCLRPFDFADAFVFATERDQAGLQTAASCVMKSPVGSDYLRYCLEACRQRDLNTVIWGEIGPRLLHEAITRFGLTAHLVAPEVFNPIDYSAFRDFQAPGFDSRRLAHAYGVHLWNQKWTTYALDPDYDGADDSLYAGLRRQYLPTEDRPTPAAALQAHAEFLERSLRQMADERDEYLYASARSAGEARWLRDELDGARQKQAALEAAHAELDERLKRTSEELGALRQSASWRLTAPLRRLFDLVRPPKQTPTGRL